MLPIVPAYSGQLPVRRPDRPPAVRPVAPVRAATDAVWEERPDVLPRPALAPASAATAAEADLPMLAPPPHRPDPRFAAYRDDAVPARGVLLDIRI